MLTTTLGLAVDDVIIGNCLGPGGNVARVAALAAGLGDAVPGVTVDRQCGSGLDAVLQAASRVRAGDAELVLAGGAESASTAPWRFWPPVGRRGADALHPGAVRPGRVPRIPEMGEAADTLAGRLRHLPAAPGRVRRAIPRADLAARPASGTFDAEIVAGAGRRTRRAPARRHDRGAAGPAAARRSAPTAPPPPAIPAAISDGAAAVAVTTEPAARDGAGLPYLRIVGAAVAAGRPGPARTGPRRRFAGCWTGRRSPSGYRRRRHRRGRDHRGLRVRRARRRSTSSGWTRTWSAPTAGRSGSGTRGARRERSC